MFASGITPVSAEVLDLVSRNRACLLHDRHPTPAGLKTSIFRNDHLIVDHCPERLCGRAFPRARCCPPPMAWLARNLASREAKGYERTQDGMSTKTQFTHRCIVAEFSSHGDYVDELVLAVA